MKHLKEIITLLVFCIIMFLFPKFVPVYFLSLLFLVFMSICCAQSWNLMAGYTGYFSFGHAVFFGAGAYTSAILITKLNLNWVLASISGGIVAIITCITLGLPIILYLRGPYFAISMLGLMASLRVLSSYWESLTGGGYGISIRPDVNIASCFYAMGFLTLIACYIIYKLVVSMYGYRLMGIREDELASNVMGVNISRYKLLSFGLSAFFIGVAGGIFSYYQSYLDPESAFNFSINVQMIAIVIFGGIGTISGPIIGGFVLGLFSEILWTYFPHFHQVIYGLMIIAMVIFMPEGIIKYVRQIYDLIKGRKLWGTKFYSSKM